MEPLDMIGISFKAKYVKRTGGPGNYKYWYRNPKTGKLQAGKQPSEKPLSAEAMGHMSNAILQQQTQSKKPKAVRDSAKKELQRRAKIEGAIEKLHLQKKKRESDRIQVANRKLRREKEARDAQTKLKVEVHNDAVFREIQKIRKEKYEDNRKIGLEAGKKTVEFDKKIRALKKQKDEVLDKLYDKRRDRFKEYSRKEAALEKQLDKRGEPLTPDQNQYYHGEIA